MADSVENKRIELHLPADNAMMLVIRLTAAGVITRAGATVDRMDDLKMAVEEACNCLMDQARAPRMLHIAFDLEANGLNIHIEGQYADETLTDSALKGQRLDDDGEIEKCILESLVDSAEITIVNGWIAAIGMKAKVLQ